jgi:ribonuclease P protein component
MQRRHRLAHNKQFEEVRHYGRSWSHPLLVLSAHGNDQAHSRFGFVVSKRIGNAVVRNRVKRRLREATRARLPDIAPGWDVLLIARSAIVNAQFVEIAEALDALLDRAGLFLTALGLPDVAE